MASAQRRRMVGQAGRRRRHAALAPEQPLRPPQQEQDRQRVDEQRPALRHVLLEHEVEDADQERRVEDAGHAPEAAHRHHDQEVHEVLERVLRVEAEELGAEPAAERGHAAAEGEGDREQAADVDAERLGHAPVVDGGADLRPDARALEGEPEADGDRDPDRDEDHAVRAVPRDAQIDLTLQERGGA